MLYVLKTTALAETVVFCLKSNLDIKQVHIYYIAPSGYVQR